MRSVTQRGESNWIDLPTEDRFLVVDWAARYLSRNPGPAAELGAGVIRFGSGMRSRRIEGRGPARFVDEPTLVVVVERKLSKTAARRIRPADLVPEQIQLTVPLRGRRLVMAIPTDVQDDQRPPRAHAQPRGLCARDERGLQPIRGVACALVRNKSGSPARYLLGCHHVVFRSLLTANGLPDPFASISTVPTDDGESQLGVPTRPARFGPAETASLDAGLVRLTPPGLEIVSQPAYGLTQPIGIAQSLQEIRTLATHFGMELVSRGSKRVHLTYRQHHINQPVRYESGLIVEIAELIRCEAIDAGQTPPIPGDSGAAVLSQGFLIGMHIAGTPEERSSYVLPAYLLIDGPAFTDRFVLADLR